MTRRILCVCLGNTCRSPMAEGAIRSMAAEAGLECDDGIVGILVGCQPDARVRGFLDQGRSERVYFGADLADAQGRLDTLQLPGCQRQALEVDRGAFLTARQAFQSVTNLVQKWFDIACRHLRLDLDVVQGAQRGLHRSWQRATPG